MVDPYATIVLIPARRNSTRVKNKNIRLLNNRPLMTYAISTALYRGLFDGVYVSSDSKEYLDIAVNYGARPIRRPKELSQGDIPTDRWVSHALANISIAPDIIVILRPTSPFIGIGDIMRGLVSLRKNKKADSVRSIRAASEHPLKMWKTSGQFISPAFHDIFDDYHNNPTQLIPSGYYIQTGGLEIFWKKTLQKYKTTSGRAVLPLILDQYTGLDINTEEDFIRAEIMVHNGQVKIPFIRAGV